MNASPLANMARGAVADPYLLQSVHGHVQLDGHLQRADHGLLNVARKERAVGFHQDFGDVAIFILELDGLREFGGQFLGQPIVSQPIHGPAAVEAIDGGVVKLRGGVSHVI